MRIIQIATASLLALAALYWADKTLALLLGFVAGASTLFAATSVLGYWLMRTHVSRIAKRERDYFLDIQHSVDKEQYE